MVDLDSKSIFLMVGYPGSGKSTLAKKIVSHCRCLYLSSDVMRQQLFQTSRFDQVGDQVIKSQSAKVYQLLYQRAIKEYQADKKVVIDATHLLTAKRQQAIDLLLSVVKPAAICFVIVNTPYPVIKQRMSAYKTTSTGTDENVYQAWQRVYQLFARDQQLGRLSWPKAGLIETVNQKLVVAWMES